MATKYRQQLNAATMLGQSKSVIQAEIDSAAELVDFFRMHAYFAKEALKYQPISTNSKETLNSMRYRGMDGFVAAVSPFNFTAIGGNLSYTPALMVCIFFYYFIFMYLTIQMIYTLKIQVQYMLYNKCILQTLYHTFLG